MIYKQSQLIKRLKFHGIYVYYFKNNRKSCLVEIDNTLILIGELKVSSITIEETTPYIATLYVDGKKCAMVRNAGFGGSATLCMIDDNLDKEKSSLCNLEMRLNKIVPLLSLEKLCDILVYNLLLG